MLPDRFAECRAWTKASEGTDKVSSIYREDGSRHVNARVRSEKQQGAIQVFWLPKGSTRNASAEAIASLAGKEFLVEVGGDVAGQYGVGTYAVAGQFQCQALRR